MQNHDQRWYRKLYLTPKWICALCNVDHVYHTRQSFHEHLEEDHSIEFSKSLLRGISRQSKIKQQRDWTECLLCSFGVEEGDGKECSAGFKRQRSFPQSNSSEQAGTSLTNLNVGRHDPSKRKSNMSYDSDSDIDSDSDSIPKENSARYQDRLLAMSQHVWNHLQMLMLLTLRFDELMLDSSQGDGYYVDSDLVEVDENAQSAFGDSEKHSVSNMNIDTGFDMKQEEFGTAEGVSQGNRPNQDSNVPDCNFQMNVPTPYDNLTAEADEFMQGILQAGAFKSEPSESRDEELAIASRGLNIVGHFLDHEQWKETESLQVQVMETRRQGLGEEHPTTLSNMANLASMYQSQGLEQDMALSGDYIVPSMLSNVGTLLGTQFERTGAMDDLSRAVDVADKAVDATPHDHPDRAGYLSNLGNRPGRRFEWTGSIDDLNRAVDVADKAVDATPHDHPDRARRLSNLGYRLSTRFERTGSIDDLNRALASYTKGWNSRSAAPSTRIRLARSAARILASQSHWHQSSQLLREAINLLPAISPRTLQHTDKQHMLADFAGLAAVAAAAALNAGEEPYHALQLLELGRDVIAGLLMEMRGDIFELEQHLPGLADKFRSLRDELDKPAETLISPISTSDPTSWESQARRRREADQQFSDLIVEIRSQPKFGNFLLPPTANDLMAAADPNPIVVVNLSSYRCDAFIIDRHQIRVLELPDLTVEEARERASNSRLSRQAAMFHTTTVLEWLWDVICRPVLEAIGYDTPVSEDEWPRVWWIPTGPVSQLPLHAAGRHTQRLNETVLDRVMSSYASSVKALLYGRRQRDRTNTQPTLNSALLVAMRQTPGLHGNGVLPFASEEVEMLNRLCPSLGVDPIVPALRKDSVLRHLQTCRIFHFAGHGRLDPMEPSRSCLLLDDWMTDPLTVEDLRDHKLHQNPPFLAYLSACSTGANEAENLIDEGIHLISAFRLAGFRHVVGTLWEVSDRHCVDVARVLYETLCKEGMTDVAVCRGLHRAVTALRNGWVESEQAVRTAEVLSITGPERGLTNPGWVPYIHFGV